MKVQNTNYITIQGWMRTELDLKGNDLLIYAIIYGFSQTSEQKFTGSLQYLADWCGATKQGVQKNLKSLMDKGLIKKEVEKKGVYNIVAYYTTELHTPIQLSCIPMQLSCINNIDNNKDLKERKKEDISKDISKKKSFSLNHSLQEQETKSTDNVIDLYLSICVNLPKIRVITDTRKKAIKRLLNNHSLNQIKEMFEIANSSTFLAGDNDRGWKADFNWLIEEDNFVKVLEGKYNSKKKSNRKNFGESNEITTKEVNLGARRKAY